MVSSVIGYTIISVTWNTIVHAGIFISFQAGIYIMNILDWYSVTFPPLAVAFMECVLVSHVYGRCQHAELKIVHQR